MLSGNVVAAFIGLLSLTITARVLGPQSFGFLVLIYTYVLLVDGVVNFQSWQSLVKFGADALQTDDISKFRDLIKFGLIIDLGSAILGATIAVAGAYWVGQLLDWTDDVVALAQIYSLMIAFNLIGTPTAVLRLFERFGVFAGQQVAAAIFKLIGVVLAYTFDAGLPVYVMVWLATDVLGHLVLLFFGWQELHRQGVGSILKGSVRQAVRDNRQLVQFVVTTNLTGSVKLAAREFDTLAVGATLGSAAAGAYKVVKQFSGALLRLADPLYQAVYPELAKFNARLNFTDFMRFIYRTAVIAGGGATVAWLVVLAFGELILTLTVGSDYAFAHVVLSVYMIAIVIDICGTTLQPAVLSLGGANNSFIAHLVSTLLYFPILFLALDEYGLVGAGLAFVAYYLIWTAIMVVNLKVLLGRRKAAVS